MGVPSSVVVINVSRFKATCLELLTRLENRKIDAIVITRRGKPIAEVKAKAEPERKSIIGCMRGSVTFAPDYDPEETVIEEWEPNLE